MMASPLSRQLMRFFDSAYNPSDSSSIANGYSLTMLFVSLGAIYFAVLMLAVATIGIPHPDWKPDGWSPEQTKQAPMVTTGSVSAATAIKTPQFWLLWTVLFCNVTAGVGILEQASR